MLETSNFQNQTCLKESAKVTDKLTPLALCLTPCAWFKHSTCMESLWSIDAIWCPHKYAYFSCGNSHTMVCLKGWFNILYHKLPKSLTIREFKEIKLVGLCFHYQSSVYQRVVWQGSTSNSSSFLVCLTRWLVPWGVQTIASWSVMRHWHSWKPMDSNSVRHWVNKTWMSSNIIIRIGIFYCKFFCLYCRCCFFVHIFENSSWTR